MHTPLSSWASSATRVDTLTVLFPSRTPVVSLVLLHITTALLESYFPADHSNLKAPTGAFCLFYGMLKKFQFSSKFLQIKR